MNRIALLAAVGLTLACPHRAEAGRIVCRQRVTVVNQAFVATAFAVPIAVPVAPVSFVQYGSYAAPAYAGVQQGALPQSQYQATQRTYSDYARDYTEFIGLYKAWRAANAEDYTASGRSFTPQAEPPSLVHQKCAKCHSGEEPRGGLDLSDLSALTCKQIVEAVRRVVSDDPKQRMPHEPSGGHALEPSEIGSILQILSALKPDGE